MRREATPTVSEVTSCSPRSSNGSNGKKRVAERGQRAVSVGGDGLVPAGVGPQQSVVRLQHRLAVGDVEVLHLVLGQAEREEGDDACRQPGKPRFAQRFEEQAAPTTPALDQVGRGVRPDRVSGSRPAASSGRRRPLLPTAWGDVCT